jgi:hypothetical protein
MRFVSLAQLGPGSGDCPTRLVGVIPPGDGAEATERPLTQRAVPIPALGWRLRVE